MKILEELIHWGSLYILVGLLVVVFIWGENLAISPFAHKVFAIGLLVGFGFIISRWIAEHETNFLVDRKNLTESQGKKMGTD
jgi:hypothetical protein